MHIMQNKKKSARFYQYNGLAVKMNGKNNAQENVYIHVEYDNLVFDTQS